MNKLFILVRKEIKELVTRQLIISVAMMMLMFMVIGKLVKTETGKSKSLQSSVAVLDMDGTASSRDVAAKLESLGFKITALEGVDIEAAISTVKSEKLPVLLVIPAGFGKGLENFRQQKFKVYSILKSFSAISAINSPNIRRLVSFVNEHIREKVISENAPGISTSFIQNPVSLDNFVVIKDNCANVSPIEVMAFVRSQTVFIPVILFLAIIFAAQMIAIGVATEKENKTLEILLSSPINRKIIVLSKLIGAGIVALVFAGVYMIGFRSYMSSVTSGISSAAGLMARTDALVELGVVMSPSGYLLLGLSLFFAILCALAIAMILGILAEDVKSVSTVTTPLTILIMIPYFLTLFLDVNSVAPLVKYAILAIPFSHPFLAVENILARNEQLVAYGIIYEAAVFMVFVAVAARIFSSDAIFTLKLGFAKKAS